MGCGCDAAPHKRNWRLYELLEVASPTTTKIVKWSFRKVTFRQHYYQAYLVLYNRARRHLYDHLGEDGYGFIVSGSWGPMIPMFGYNWTVIVYTIFMLIEVALLILFFAFLGARDDNLISWSWEKVTAPLFVAVILMVLMTFFATLVNWISSRTRREGMHFVDRLSPLGNLLASCAYFCLPFVIGIGIKDDVHAKDGKYLTYACMPIIGDIIYYLTSLIWRWPRRLRLQMEVDDIVPSPVIYWGIFFMAFLNMFCGIAQWVLIAYKLDRRYSRSWYVTLIPFCFRAGIRIIEACLRSLMKHTVTVKSSVGVAFDTLGSFFTNSILLISLYFVAVRIERGRHKVRLPHALIPVYITLAYIFICLIITMIVLLVRGRRSNRAGNEADANWGPPPAGAGRAVGGARGQKQRGSSTTDSSLGTAKEEPMRDSRWDELDDESTTSSAAFPEDLTGLSQPRQSPERPPQPSQSQPSQSQRASPPRPPGGAMDYDDFYTDEEEELFPEPASTADVRTAYTETEGTPEQRRRADRSRPSARTTTDTASYYYDEETTYVDEESPSDNDDDEEGEGEGEETTEEWSEEESESDYSYDSYSDDYSDEDSEVSAGDVALHSRSPASSAAFTSSYESNNKRKRD